MQFSVPPCLKLTRSECVLDPSSSVYIQTYFTVPSSAYYSFGSVVLIRVSTVKNTRMQVYSRKSCHQPRGASFELRQGQEEGNSMLSDVFPARVKGKVFLLNSFRPEACLCLCVLGGCAVAGLWPLRARGVDEATVMMPTVRLQATVVLSSVTSSSSGIYPSVPPHLPNRRVKENHFEASPTEITCIVYLFRSELVLH
ncbi:hypothetical protein L798_00791 [Zootermopsis nevadensis]|uniref:Uncharacterized protein n=2 Tax=Zootermopsis nevadensis TaxID=136037 RepID=A0A067QID1_ZOONE|nr:hypothetical protein L798_00791 [Zootermopsis nevadensis]